MVPADALDEAGAAGFALGLLVGQARDRNGDAPLLELEDRAAEQLRARVIDIDDAARLDDQELHRRTPRGDGLLILPTMSCTLVKLSGAAGANTITPGSCSPWSCVLGGHHTVVPGTRASSAQ